MAQLLRLARIAAQCEQTGQSASEAIERATEQAAIGRDGPRDAGRRRFTQGAVAGAVSAAAGAGAMSPVALAGMARIRRTMVGSGGGVAVVGAGIAGLSCAYELGRHGIDTKVYEASGRVGGRCFSVRDVFPGQVAERGAEYIGASHHTMLGYARAFGLQLEDFSMLPGSTRYHFGSGSWSEAQVVEEFRAFASAMREDFAALGHPTAGRFTPAEETFDLMSLDDYLILNGAGDLLRKVIGAAYAAEYGAGIDQLSALGFLRFVHGDKRGKYAQIGAFGGEGFHVVDGNDRIASELAARLSSPVQLGHRLVAIRKLASGKVRLSFDAGGRRLQSDHDAVVLALPFSVLRDVQLDPTLELPAWKRYAIDHSAMGDGTRLMVGFKQPYWYLQHGGNGSGYSDVVRPMSTWESNPYNGNETRAVLSAQIGGAAGRAMDPRNLQAEARGFLNELELSMPGANVHALRTGTGDVVAAMHNWSLSPLSKGAYTCHRPGYFTTIAHNEGKAVGNVMFAGEHTSSFYEWQGFMEGAALSGLRAAGEVLAQARTTTSRRFNASL
jgi:monoamine oxidase